MLRATHLAERCWSPSPLATTLQTCRSTMVLPLPVHSPTLRSVVAQESRECLLGPRLLAVASPHFPQQMAGFPLPRRSPCALAAADGFNLSQ